MRATVIYDGDCGLCTQIRKAAEALDWLGTMRWVPLQDEEAAAYGIPRAELEQAVYIVRGDATARGWEAVKQIALRIPLTYLLAAAAARKSPWAALGVAILFSPLANPAGERLYDMVARNRYRFPGSTCATPVWDNRNK